MAKGLPITPACISKLVRAFEEQTRPSTKYGSIGMGNCHNLNRRVLNECPHRPAPGAARQAAAGLRVLAQRPHLAAGGPAGQWAVHRVGAGGGGGAAGTGGGVAGG